MPQIHHELIGSHPAMEHFRDSLSRVITTYESSERPKTDFNDLLALTMEERSDWVRRQLKDKDAIDRMAQVIVIQLCAEHFYGLKYDDFESIPELIDAIKGVDEDLHFS